MPRQIQQSQHDFTFGEVDVDLKRNDDHPARKAGLRQMANARIHNSRTIQNRSGRRALFPGEAGRVEEVAMSPGNLFKIAFGNGTLRVYSAAGAQVFTQSGFAWTNATAKEANFDIYQLSIWITFPGQVPQILTWDGVATWSVAAFAEQLVPTGESAGRKLTLFYRMSDKSITLVPSAVTGTITVVANKPYFVAGMVGTRINWVGKQFTITVINSPTNATARVNDTLYASENIPVISPTFFSPGDVVVGLGSGATGIVTIIGGASIHVQLNQNKASFANGEIIVGPNASSLSNGTITFEAPNAINVFDEEVINAFRGYPQSVFVDQGRLGFCDFPGVPAAIGWSRFGVFNDFLVAAVTPDDPMMELVPNKARVLYVLRGPESNEFIFCDNGVYYIPISVTNPLKPGSVAFNLLSNDGCAQVKPRPAQEAILYVNAGGNSMMAVIATGAYLRPFNTRSLSDFHAHLFNNIVAIAAPGADGTFNERYAYVLNGDGSIAVGKYDADSLTSTVPVIGWGPWSGVGTVNWIAAYAADIIFTTTYFGTGICEILDDSQYLDCALPVNAAPAAFAPPGGKGPLWFIPSQTVWLMDQVTRNMGTYQIDANGFIVPQFSGGEDLTRVSLVAGQPWTMTAEPFAPDAQSGQDMGQRMKMRQFSLFAVSFINSSGFTMAMLFSGKQSPITPALGTPMNSRRVPAYNTDEDATLPPILREWTETYPPTGSSYDPRVAIIKDTPGPLLIAEIGMEISI